MRCRHRARRLLEERRYIHREVRGDVCLYTQIFGCSGKQPNLKGVFGVTIVDTCSSLVSELKPRKER